MPRLPEPLQRSWKPELQIALQVFAAVLQGFMNAPRSDDNR